MGVISECAEDPLLVEVGLFDQEVAAISGHKSMQMLSRYTHLRSEDLVKKLDGLRDSVIELIDPFEPGGEENWEALSDRSLYI